MARMADEPRPLIWRGASKADFMAFPISWPFLLPFSARWGTRYFWRKWANAIRAWRRPLKGFGGGAVIEVRESFEGSAYRAVYTVRYADAVYVLHAFQKKSKRGDVTPKAEIDLIEKRLKDLIREKEKQR
jgi:phage-related protein